MIEEQQTLLGDLESNIDLDTDFASSEIISVADSDWVAPQEREANFARRHNKIRRYQSQRRPKQLGTSPSSAYLKADDPAIYENGKFSLSDFFFFLQRIRSKQPINILYCRF